MSEGRRVIDEVRSTYDDFGRLASVTDFHGQCTEYEYNEEGKETCVRTFAAPIAQQAVAGVDVQKDCILIGIFPEKTS